MYEEGRAEGGGGWLRVLEVPCRFADLMKTLLKTGVLRGNEESRTPVFNTVAVPFSLSVPTACISGVEFGKHAH
jgi:hypothetical protein